MSEKNIVLSAKHLKKSYGKGEATVQALSDVSLDIYEGELLAILGSSGSGKSTLLNMLGGMDQPDEGSITVGGRELAKMKDKELTRYRREDVGFVFQSFNLIAELTAKENVAITASVQKDKDIVKNMLELVGLGAKLNNYPMQMSGGEQQRVSIARALAKDPRLLLCDEPTGALDFETGKQILIALEKLVRVHGKTVVIVTHTQEIGRMADRTIRMRSGKIIEQTVNEAPVSAELVEW